MGTTVSVAAVALGAKIVEKHFILDRKIGGPDASFSMEPEEFSQMVSDIRIIEEALGKASLELTEKQKLGRAGMRSLFVVNPVKKGEKFTEKNIRSIRPGFGMHPKYYYEVIGKKAARDLDFGQPLKMEDVE